MRVHTAAFQAVNDMSEPPSNEESPLLTARELARQSQEISALKEANQETLKLLQQISAGLLGGSRPADGDIGLRARLLELERDQALAMAEARLQVIRAQQRELAGLRRWNPFLRLRSMAVPRLGLLEQHAPRTLKTPERYIVQPPRPAPKISLVTTSYNHGAFIGRTLGSVLNQEYPQLEYVIRDAGSMDETLTSVKPYQSRLAYFESAPDRGFSNGLNIGFEQTSGEIMAYLNSDDLLLPGALAYVAHYFLQHPDVDVVYGHRVIIDEYDAEVGRWVMPPHDDEVLSWADYVPQETMFWRRGIWDRAGGHIDESFQFAVDWDLLLRFRAAGATIHRLPRFLGAFRFHPHQKSTAEIDDLGAREMARLRERTLGRKVGPHEIQQAVKPYLRRHVIYHKLWRLGLARY
jgi:glycosyltransferase involved in cell wall biosynthesis